MPRPLIGHEPSFFDIALHGIHGITKAGRAIGICAAMILPLWSLPAGEEPPLEWITKEVSLEEPRLNLTQASMTLGLDGFVYLAANSRPGYVFRVDSRDGTSRGGDVVYSLRNATGNAEGVMATANAHFAASVNIYNPDFELIQGAKVFQSGPGYNSPSGVEALTDGSFLAMDPQRKALIRIDAKGIPLASVAIPASGDPVSFTAYSAEGARIVRLKDGILLAVDPSGKLLWQMPSKGSSFALDAEGRLYVYHALDSRIQIIGPDGREVGSFPLDPLPQPLRTGQEPRKIQALDWYDGKLFVKTNHPTELFRVYDATNGKFLSERHARLGKLRVGLPGLRWVAGTRVKLPIDWSGEASTPVAWSVYLCRLGDDHWERLPWLDGEVEIPVGSGGLYQLRVHGGSTPVFESPLQVREIIEISTPGSEGTCSIFTPLNRIYFPPGEAISATALLRAKEPATIRFRLTGPDGFELPLQESVLQPGLPFALVLDSSTTARLKTGRYLLTASAPTLTIAPQALVLGKPLIAGPRFRQTVHADYGNTSSTADYLSFADKAAALLDEARTQGFNFYVNRIFSSRYPLAFSNTPDGAQMETAMMKRLESNPTGTAPEKAKFGFPQAHALGAWGSFGIREMLLLIMMDEGLPIGSDKHARGILHQIAEIEKYTSAVKNITGFAGWVWTANWWIRERTLDATEKEEYTKALKSATTSGTWSPVLEKIGDRAIRWSVEAQEAFGKALHALDPEAKTATAGPYRRPEVYPPVSFSNVDEIDLHFQSEQITAPNWTAHAPNYYRVKGKPAWLHPELWNDSGTGEHIGHLAWLGFMRGAKGFGNSGRLPFFENRPEDPRSGQFGTISYFTALNAWAGLYGPWLSGFEVADSIAIPVSFRQVKMESFSRGGSVGGLYFSRQYEAYHSFLHSGFPASFVYAEEAPDFKKIKALVIVSQEVEPEPEFLKMVAEARAAGCGIFIDRTSRKEFFPDAEVLPVGFNQLDRVHAMNYDHAYWVFPKTWLEHAAKLREIFTPLLPEAMVRADHPEVLTATQTFGEMTLHWVVNSVHHPLRPELLWRMSLGIASRLPINTKIKIRHPADHHVYCLNDQSTIHSAPERSWWQGWFSGLFGSSTSRDPSTFVTSTVNKTIAGGQALQFLVTPSRIPPPKLSVKGALKPGSSVEWTLDFANVDGPLPVKMQLIEAGEKPIREETTAEKTGKWTIPVNITGTPKLVATELVTGQSSGTPPPGLALPNFNLARLRDLAVSPDGKFALINAFDWSDNLFVLDCETGKVVQSLRVGQWFAFAPSATEASFFVQGFDATTPEGYQLYALSTSGKLQARFTVPGIPGRIYPWSFPTTLPAPRHDTATAPDARWTAVTGSMGLVIWSAEGKLLKALDWSASERKFVHLAALSNDVLVLEEGGSFRALQIDATNSSALQEIWSLALPGNLPVHGFRAHLASNSLLAWSRNNGGHTFLIQDAKIVCAIPGTVSSAFFDGNHIATVSARQLTVFTHSGQPVAALTADSRVVSVAFSPAGEEITYSTEGGKVFRLALQGNGLPAAKPLLVDGVGLRKPHYLPGGDLLLVGWMGTVTRLDDSGRTVWSRQVPVSGNPDLRTEPSLSKNTDKHFVWRAWENATSSPGLSMNNVLQPNEAVILADLTLRPINLQNDTTWLFDGKLDPPKNPWIDLHSLGLVDSGWRGHFNLEFHLLNRRARIHAITLHEDPSHPESWIRDASLEAWNPDSGNWDFVQYLTSNQPVHTHVLKTPVEASRLRLRAPHLLGWPSGNLRLAEVVLHGEQIGAAHPAIYKGLDSAILYDEQPIFGAISTSRGGYEPLGAAQGAQWIRLMNGSLNTPNFATKGQVFPDWDFQIKETPEPGQFRYLRFKVKRLAGETTTAGVILNKKLYYVGPLSAKLSESHPGAHQAAPQLSPDWQTVTVDLWQHGNPKSRGPIQSLALFTEGGPAGFDAVSLERLP